MFGGMKLRPEHWSVNWSGRSGSAHSADLCFIRYVFFGWTVAACALRRALHLRAFYNDFPIRSEPAAMRWRLALCRVARANGK